MQSGSYRWPVGLLPTKRACIDWSRENLGAIRGAIRLPKNSLERLSRQRPSAIASSPTERALQLLRSELQPLSVWKRRRRDWLRRLRPYGYWLVWHTSVRGRG